MIFEWLFQAVGISLRYPRQAVNKQWLSCRFWKKCEYHSLLLGFWNKSQPLNSWKYWKHKHRMSKSPDTLLCLPLTASLTNSEEKSMFAQSFEHTVCLEQLLRLLKILSLRYLRQPVNKQWLSCRFWNKCEHQCLLLGFWNKSQPLNSWKYWTRKHRMSKSPDTLLCLL